MESMPSRCAPVPRRSRTGGIVLAAVLVVAVVGCSAQATGPVPGAVDGLFSPAGEVWRSVWEASDDIELQARTDFIPIGRAPSPRR